tara:strand:+ start:1021 stop:1338 length:318 start_codon:yes stop_codon:yes gene_type:complete
MKRAPRAVWAEEETALLEYAVSLYEWRKVDHRAIARLFVDRSAADVKKRCAVLRDRKRRRERWSALRDTEQPTDSGNESLPCNGELHPTLVWVPAQWHDLEPIAW